MELSENPSGPHHEDSSEPWWRPALFLFGEATAWIAFPLIGALYLGSYLDERSGGGQWYTLGIVGIAFVISCIGIGMIGVKYVKQAEAESAKKQSANDKSS